MHLLFNMFSLFVFGPELEKIAGKARFLTIYMFSGIFGNIATFFLQDPDYATSAQAVRFSVFSVHLVHSSITRSTSFPQLRQIIVPIIVISIIMTFLQPNINTTAHIVGMIVGFLIGLSYFHPKRIVSWRTRKR